MTKRSRDSIAVSPDSELFQRQVSHDVEAVGSQDDVEGSALKKARSFMATLVSERTLSSAAMLTLKGLRCVPFEENQM